MSDAKTIETNACRKSDRGHIIPVIGGKAVSSHRWDPWPEPPDWSKDQVITTVDVRLSWSDRLLLLLTGEFRMDVRTNTEHLPGRCESWSRFYPRRIRLPWRRRVLFVEETHDGPD